MGRLSENAMVNIRNTSHAVTADIVVPEGDTRGVLIAQGGAFGGWSLYLHEGLPKYCNRFFGVTRFTVEGDTPVPAGAHQVRMEFAYDGGGLAKGGTVTLFVDGQRVAEGRIEHTQPLIFSADETADVGNETGSTVSDDYDAESSRFTGTINWVQIDLGEDAGDADHLISPEERLQIAMERQ